jgi:hypothetical protein
VSKNLAGAERSGGAEYQKIGGAERSWSGPLRSLRSAPLKTRSTAPRILNPAGDQLIQDGNFNYALFVLILCEWKTAWTLLFKPLENDEKEKIEKEFEVKWKIEFLKNA